MAVFKMYHINHGQMRLFKDIKTPGCTRVHNVYRELMSNRQLSEASSEVAITNAWKKKVDAAHTLLHAQYYKHVATISATNLMSAIQMTQSIDGPWYLHTNPSVDVNFNNLPHRSTHRHDIVVANDDTHFMYSGIKFINMQSLEII